MTAFVRAERRSRQTGTTVLVLDTASPDCTVGTEDGLRWATLCDDHGGIVYHSTLGDARAWASEPATWCPDCEAVSPMGDR